MGHLQELPHGSTGEAAASTEGQDAASQRIPKASHHGCSLLHAHEQVDFKRQNKRLLAAHEVYTDRLAPHDTPQESY